MIDKNRYVSNPAELRINNLVYHYKNGLYEFHYPDFREFDHPKMDGFYGFYPILLTEAVLMAAGYVYFDNGEDWGYTNLTGLRVSDYNDEYFYLDILDQEGIALEIKTLHQFQNLIFALTGKELVINMEELKKAVG